MKKGFSVICVAISLIISNSYAAGEKNYGIMKESFVQNIAQQKINEMKEEQARAQKQQKEIEIRSFNFLKFNEKIDEIFISNPDIADIEMMDDRSFYLRGEAPGVTSLLVYKDGKVFADYQIRVTYPLKEIKAAVAKVLPDIPIELISVEDNLILKGKVPSPEAAQEVIDVVGRFIDSGKIINKLVIETSTQVLLKVKVAEVTRTVSKELGIRWRALSSGKTQDSGMIGFSSGPKVLPKYAEDLKAAETALIDPGDDGILTKLDGGRWFVSAGINNLSALIDALASEAFASLLAEPTLVALSGQAASFNVGGEEGYFVTQANSNSRTTEFKNWGTQIGFTPIVLSEDRINIKISATVSNLSKKTAADAAPTLNTKTLDTTVELGSGQSLALAGFIQTNKKSSAGEVPGLASIPFLGALFRHSSTEVSETEVVIIVTPYIVKPSSKQLKTPVDMEPRLLSPIDSVLERRFHKNAGRVRSAGFSLR